MATFFKDFLAGLLAGDLVGQGSWIARSTVAMDHPVVLADGTIQATGAVFAGATYSNGTVGLDLTKPFTVRLGWILRDNYPGGPLCSVGVEDGGQTAGMSFNTDPFHFNGDNAPTAVPYWYDFEDQDADGNALGLPANFGPLAGNVPQYASIRFNGTASTARVFGGVNGTSLLSNVTVNGVDAPSTWTSADVFLYLSAAVDNTKSQISAFTISSDPTVSVSAGNTTVAGTGNTLTSTVAGNGNLTYAWTTPVKPSGGAATYGNSSVANTTVAYSKAGSYRHTLTVSDPYGGFNSALVNVTVSQTLTTITVSPSTAKLANGANQTFTVATLDQFGNSMANVGITGSITLGNGTLSNRTYTSDGNKAVVKFSNGTVSGSANINFPAGFGSLAQWRGKLGNGVLNRFRWRS